MSWETEDFGDDPGRREWHERKIENKCARARRQLDLLGLSSGVVMHRSRRGRGGGGREAKMGVSPSPMIPDAHAHDNFAIRRGDTMLDAWGAAISTSMRRPDKILQLVAAMDIPRP